MESLSRSKFSNTDGEVNEAAENRHPFGRIEELWNRNGADIEVPGGVCSFLVDNVWFRAGVQYSINEYWDDTVPSKESGQRVVSLCKRPTRQPPPSSSVTYVLGVSGFGSLSWFQVPGTYFDEGAGKHVALKEFGF